MIFPLVRPNSSASAALFHRSFGSFVEQPVEWPEPASRRYPSGRRSGAMGPKKTLSVALFLVACVAVFLVVLAVRSWSGRLVAALSQSTTTTLEDEVTSSRGPEAGVWVIAETRSTPTRLIKSVVTDDQGRYLIPDLPSGEYDVWVRGYGLVDSAKVKTTPGKIVNGRLFEGYANKHLQKIFEHRKIATRQL